LEHSPSAFPISKMRWITAPLPVESEKPVEPSVNGRARSKGIRGRENRPASVAWSSTASARSAAEMKERREVRLLH
jgi:hypothetical protein